MQESPEAGVGWGHGRTFLLDLGWVIVNNFKGTFQSKEAVNSFLPVRTSFRWKFQHNQAWVLRKKRRSWYEGPATRQLFIKVPSTVAPCLLYPESRSWSITMTSETCSHLCSHGKCAVKPRAGPFNKWKQLVSLFPKLWKHPYNWWMVLLDAHTAHENDSKGLELRGSVPYSTQSVSSQLKL